MNDRELLEMAAKAAGYDGVYMSRNSCQEQGLEGSEGMSIKRMPLDGGWRYWNPLTDDGDALRLAVKLRIHIEWTSTFSKHKEEWVNTFPKSLGHLSDLTSLGDDPYAATRRAIVRAASEIGKSMP